MIETIIALLLLFVEAFIMIYEIALFYTLISTIIVASRYMKKLIELFDYINSHVG